MPCDLDTWVHVVPDLGRLLCDLGSLSFDCLVRMSVTDSQARFTWGMVPEIYKCQIIIQYVLLSMHGVYSDQVYMYCGMVLGTLCLLVSFKSSSNSSSYEVGPEVKELEGEKF